MDFSVIFSATALGISGISVGLTLWIAMRRAEHPDVAELKSRIMALDQECTDINDRLGQWMRRESVRRLRENREAANAAEPVSALRGSKDYKQALRLKMMGRMSDEPVR